MQLHVGLLATLSNGLANAMIEVLVEQTESHRLQALVAAATWVSTSMQY